MCRISVCACGAHSRRKRTVTAPQRPPSASLIDAHATTGSLTDCWMNIPLIDVTDNWPDVPPAPPSPALTPPPLAQHQPGVSGVVQVFSRNIFSLYCCHPGDWLENFLGWGLSNRLGWHQRQIDATGRVMKTDFFVDEFKQQQSLQGMESMSSCLHTSRSMPAVAFELLPNDQILSSLILLKAVRLSSVSASWWIVKECALFVFQGPLYNIMPPWCFCLLVRAILFTFMLPCQVLSFRVSGASAFCY